MSDRQVEGYAKQGKFRDAVTDALVDPGDAMNNAVRTNQVTPDTALWPDGRVGSVPGESGEGQRTYDPRLRYLMQVQIEWLKKIFFAIQGLHGDYSGPVEAMVSANHLSGPGFDPMDYGQNEPYSIADSL